MSPEQVANILVDLIIQLLGSAAAKDIVMRKIDIAQANQITDILEEQKFGE